MKIEEIFKQNLQNGEMEVDNSLWDKLESRMNNGGGVNNPVKSPAEKLISVINPTKSVIGKIISAVSLAGIVTGGVLLYNSIDKQTSENNQIASENSLNSNDESDNSINYNDTKIEYTANGSVNDAVRQNSDEKQKEYNGLSEVNFDIADENDLTNITESEIALPEPVITPNPDPIVLHTVDNHNDNPQEQQANPSRTDPQYRIDIHIPNFLSPNGDGINDCFEIKGIENYQDNKLVISNRNGKVVYRKDNYNNEFCGQNLPAEVYFYILTVRNQGKSKDFRGQITLIY